MLVVNDLSEFSLVFEFHLDLFEFFSHDFVVVSPSKYELAFEGAVVGVEVFDLLDDFLCELDDCFDLF